ncbi:flagellar motor protein MotB [Roseobacter sp.]|uniref:flagellar motor protein MotB n=1 Tax=Roseobacter sp. TaxID=1907202 RepID=UPI0032967D85
MAAQSNLAPVIIKRKKIIAAGHHGGAWKVAYADFVTAMMAFFMMMWLLSATTEEQRAGLADYFAPTIPVNRVSGGGDGAFGGESIFSEETLPQNGLGATSEYAAQQDQSRGDSGTSSDDGEQDASQDASVDQFEDIVEALTAMGGESTVMEEALKHVVTRITDEGLVIELFALDGLPLFVAGTDQPTTLMTTLMDMVASVSQTVTNAIAVEGHVSAGAVVLASNPVWDNSTDRATRTRLMLQQNGIGNERIQRVTGHADREPVHRNPMATRNNRVEIVLLR